MYCAGPENRLRIFVSARLPALLRGSCPWQERHTSGTFANEVVFFSRSGFPVCLRGIFKTR
jgi:hypothetical protein